MSLRWFIYSVACCGALAFLGCATSTVAEPAGVHPTRVPVDQVSRGAGTGIEAQDLQEVSDKMARSILGTQAIANASSPPTVALLPVENDTRFPINKEIFTRRIKALLNQQCGARVLFVARDRIDAVERERELKREGMVGSSGEKIMAGVDYFLTGELTGMSQTGSTGQSDYVLYTFRLIDAESGIEQWENFHEIKKEGLEDVVYR